jgi:hypothetical protein
MQKIASPQELQTELRSLIAFIHSYGPEGKPARQVVANRLRALADRVSMEHSSPEALKRYLKEHPDADKSKHTVKKPSGGRDVSNEKGFEALKGLDPAKQRDIIQKAILNMEAEKDEDKKGPSKQKDVSREEGFEALKGLSPGAQRRVIERALKNK